MTQTGSGAESAGMPLLVTLEQGSFQEALTMISDRVDQKELSVTDASVSILYICRNLEQVHSKQAENVERIVMRLCGVGFPVLKLALLSFSNCGCVKERIALFSAHILKRLNMLCIKLQEKDVMLLPRPLFNEDELQQLNACGAKVAICNNAAKEYSENVLKMACENNRVGQYAQKHLTELTVCVDKTQLAFCMVELHFRLEYDQSISADEVLARDDQICQQVSNETLYQYILLMERSAGNTRQDNSETSNTASAQDNQQRASSISQDQQVSAQKQCALIKEAIPYKQSVEPVQDKLLLPVVARKSLRQNAPEEILAATFQQLAASVNPFSECEYNDENFEENTKDAFDYYFDFICAYVSGKQPSANAVLEMQHFASVVLVFQCNAVNQQKLKQFLTGCIKFANSFTQNNETPLKEQLECCFDSAISAFGFDDVFCIASNEYKFTRTLQIVSLFSIKGIGDILGLSVSQTKFLSSVYERKHSEYAGIFQAVNACGAKTAPFSIFGSIRKTSYFFLNALLQHVFSDIQKNGEFCKYLAESDCKEINLVHQLFTRQGSNDQPQKQSKDSGAAQQPEKRPASRSSSQRKQYSKNRLENSTVKRSGSTGKAAFQEKELTLRQQYQLLSDDQNKIAFINSRLSDLESKEQVSLLSQILKTENTHIVLQAACSALKAKTFTPELQQMCVTGAMSLFKRGFAQLAYTVLNILQFDQLVLNDNASPFAQEAYSVLEKCSDVSQSATIGYISKIMQTLPQHSQPNDFIKQCYSLCQKLKYVKPQPQYRQYIKLYDEIFKARRSQSESKVQNLRRCSMESISSSRGQSRIRSNASIQSEISEALTISSFSSRAVTPTSESVIGRSILKTATPRSKQTDSEYSKSRQTPQNRQATTDESQVRARKLILQQFNTRYLVQQFRYVDFRDVSSLDKSVKLLGEVSKRFDKYESQLDMLYQIIVACAEKELDGQKMFLSAQQVKNIESFCKAFKISVLSVDQYQIQQLTAFLLRVYPYFPSPNKFILDVIQSMRASLTEKFYTQLLCFTNLKILTIQLVLDLVRQFVGKQRSVQDQLWARMIACASDCNSGDDAVKQLCDFVQSHLHFRDLESLKRFLYGCAIPEDSVQKSLAMFKHCIPETFSDVRQQLNEVSKPLEESLNAIKVELSNIDDPSELLKTQDLLDKSSQINEILKSQATPDTIELAVKQISEVDALKASELISWAIKNLQHGNDYDNGLIFAMLEREQDQRKDTFTLSGVDMQNVIRYWLSDPHGQFERIIFRLFQTQLEGKLSLTQLFTFFERIQAESFIQRFRLETLCKELIVDAFDKLGVFALQTELQQFIAEIQSDTPFRTATINLIDELLQAQ